MGEADRQAPSRQREWMLAAAKVRAGRGVALALMAHADISLRKIVWPSLETLAREMAETRTSAKRGMRALIAAGLIEVKSKRHGQTWERRFVLPGPEVARVERGPGQIRPDTRAGSGPPPGPHVAPRTGSGNEVKEQDPAPASAGAASSPRRRPAKAPTAPSATEDVKRLWDEAHARRFGAFPCPPSSPPCPHAGHRICLDHGRGYAGWSQAREQRAAKAIGQAGGLARLPALFDAFMASKDAAFDLSLTWFQRNRPKYETQTPTTPARDAAAEERRRAAYEDWKAKRAAERAAGGAA